MDRSLLLGIVGSLSVFIVICSFILLSQPDFDEQLIVQVNRGIPAEELIPQIDKEAYDMRKDAKKQLDSRIMDRKYWGNGDLDDPHNLRSYVNIYEGDLEAINEYRKTRISFVKREITKEEFLNRARLYKYDMKLIKG